jgi:tRNA(fMet)-specific endonuclease VapC
MTYQYLLDSNIISDLVRHPQGLVFQRLTAEEETAFVPALLWCANCGLVQLKVALSVFFTN